MLNEGFDRLDSGQDEILTLLAKQNVTITAIGTSVDNGFKEAGKQVDEAFQKIAGKLAELQLQLEMVSAQGKTDREANEIPDLTPEQAYDQGYAFQADAMRWVLVRNADSASQRLARGRELVEHTLEKYPDRWDLLGLLGYIEKTQAQVAQIEWDHESYVGSLEKAAKCFATVLKNEPRDVGALNGMANIYSFHNDFDRAIELGTLAVRSAPNYGAAVWDLALALEGKIKQAGPDKPLLDRLINVYQALEQLMPQQAEVFTAADLAYVHKREQELIEAAGS